MKNRMPFAALTAAFTVAGACIGYGCRNDPPLVVCLVLVIAVIGGAAAALSGPDV